MSEDHEPWSWALAWRLIEDRDHRVYSGEDEEETEDEEEFCFIVCMGNRPSCLLLLLLLLLLLRCLATIVSQ
jgi:hypothetical protein